MNGRVLALVLAAVLSACAARQRTDVARAQRALAQELIRRGDLEHAFQAADALCRSAPEEPDGYWLRGVVYREQRLDKEAEGDLGEALRLDPGHAPAHSALAILYDARGRGEEAIRHHRRAAALDPRNPAYKNNLGFSLYAHGRPRDAVPVLEEALRGAPTDARIRNNLGFALAATGDFTGAQEQFARAGSLAEALNNLGWAYERRGDLGHAYDLYVQSIRQDPAAAAPRENLQRVARAASRDAPADLPPPPERG
ncbi:tetratricopeptide repeat protein [Anaeromyxobacter oryzisoli]|uniref:tetratricopeptide repeat protein n=1 Tax=Anaeromyxobacter oryzisoli TaxID=2925408 RepID=UPI001F58DAE3|nr:tetratricopeptide repeat protein [Anaeromyxobacter sp. SG63]